MVNAGREAMMAYGRIEAQKDEHPNDRPVGVAIYTRRYTRGSYVTLKSERAANYVRSCAATCSRRPSAGRRPTPA